MHVVAQEATLAEKPSHGLLHRIGVAGSKIFGTHRPLRMQTVWQNAPPQVT